MRAAAVGPPMDVPVGFLTSVPLFHDRALVNREVLGFIALDLILWIIQGRMMRVPLYSMSFL